MTGQFIATADLSTRVRNFVQFSGTVSALQTALNTEFSATAGNVQCFADTSSGLTSNAVVIGADNTVFSMAPDSWVGYANGQWTQVSNATMGTSFTPYYASGGAVGVPSYAGTRTGSYDTERSIYNWTSANTFRLRAALGAARAGTGLCRIAWLGDSLTEGFGAVQGVSDPPQLVRNAVARAGYPVATLVQPVNNGSTNPADPVFDTRIAVSGLEVATSATFPWLESSAADQSVTLTSDVAGTVLEIVCTGQSPMTYTVDGGSAVTVPVSGSSDIELVTITGLADTMHTVVLTSTASSPSALINSLGIRGTTGVVMDVHPICGSSSADWQPTESYTGVAVVLVAAPDVVVVETGVYDYLAGGVPLSTTKANIETIISTIQDANTDVLLVASHRPDDTDAYLEHLSMMYDVADDMDVPLLDLGDAFGTFADWSSDTIVPGLSAFGDIHMSASGYTMKAATEVHLFPWLD